MRSGRLVSAAAAATLLLGTGVVAHVRLHNPSNGMPLFWSVPGAISIVINSAGSDNIPDGSHETSIRSAIQSWNAVPGTSMQLVEDTSASSQARTDWQSSGIHLVYFDESNDSGFFPGGSGIVAITPVWFFAGGSITDADILFNGSQFTFTTDASSSAMDVEDVVAHELGHFLGLDHSGVVGSTMYPFVSGSVTAHRSLSSDEIGGMRTAYPAGSSATLTGTVLRQSDSSPVAGAWVVARDANGRTAGSALANASGDFSIRGLDGGTYTVYASPLDAPVSAGNLTSGHTIQTDFEPTTYGSAAVVGGGSTLALGNLLVGADVGVNLGVAGDPLPLSATADGVTRAFVLRGTGLAIGSGLTVSDPNLTVTPTAFLGSTVQFQLTVPIGTAPGLVDVEVVTGGGDRAVLPGAIEVVPPAPTVSGVSPTIGQATGGTAVTISGTGFRAGARVVLGDQLYVDGVSGGCTVVNSTTITLTMAATASGTHDVVVLDAAGVEGRMASAFTVAMIPSIDSTFPSTGTSAGGTEVTLTGENFMAGLAVRINGITQNTVTIESPTLLRFTSESGVPGGPYTLEVQNVGGGLATSAFAYVSNPDPDVQTITPASGDAVGGETIRLVGTGFTPSTQVRFGVDPDTGQGGTAASSVTFIDSNNLDVVTPAFGAGSASLLASNSTTGQAEVVAAGFTFTSADDGGGGGGCQTAYYPGDPRQSLSNALLSSAWLLLLAGYLGLRAHRAARRPSPVRLRQR